MTNQPQNPYSYHTGTNQDLQDKGKELLGRADLSAFSVYPCSLLNPSVLVELIILHLQKASEGLSSHVSAASTMTEGSQKGGSREFIPTCPRQETPMSLQGAAKMGGVWTELPFYDQLSWSGMTI